MQLAISLVRLIYGHYALRRREPANNALGSGKAAWPIPSVGIDRDTSLRGTSPPERPVLTAPSLGYVAWVVTGCTDMSVP